MHFDGIEIELGDLGNLLYQSGNAQQQVFDGFLICWRSSPVSLQQPVTADPLYHLGRIAIGKRRDSEDDIAEITKPFFQVDSALSRKFEGTGLGLYLVKKFLELHEATLEFDSELGAGTRAIVRFPCARVIAAEDTERQAPSAEPDAPAALAS